VFFSQPDAFDVLTAEVLPGLIQRATAESAVRVWVPACSTGEEAYSLAICFCEQFRAACREPHLRIFATDTNERALAIARQGVYDDSILSAVSAERLQRYFEQTAAQRYRIKDQIRDTLVIGVQNLLKDPPIFSNLDLISYRNVPADLESGVLRRLSARFHFALKENGWLLFGAAEAVAPAVELFEPVSVKWSLYRKRGRASTEAPIEFPPATELLHHNAYLELKLQTANRKIASMAEELEIANEELRDSNAELRSVNEELAVLNNALQHKVRALNATNDDLTTLIAAIDVAVIFLDADLNIRRFTPAAARLLKLTLDVVGRPLSEVASELADHGLPEEARRVIATSAPSEREIRSDARHWYLLRVLPYPPAEHPLGAVVTWIDITQAKSLQEEVSGIAVLEQQRIGQELHDGTLQELTGLGLLAQNLSESLALEDRTADRALADRLARGIAEANRHVRALARGLVPVPIDADSLAPALAELAASTRETFGTACSFELSGPVKMSNSDTATHLYRIAQEAVRNAASHSKADRISIQLGHSNGDLVLEVRDNGIGIPPRTQMHRGVGLRLMEHRCSLLGGRFIAEPQPGGGTVVACKLRATADNRLPV
jgi:chemotaxis methyl-accepting protein methylase/signal transduction histidine kinase